MQIEKKKIDPGVKAAKFTVSMLSHFDFVVCFFLIILKKNQKHYIIFFIGLIGPMLNNIRTRLELKGAKCSS